VKVVTTAITCTAAFAGPQAAIAGRLVCYTVASWAGNSIYNDFEDEDDEAEL
jgi:hypothetical protein